MRRIMPHFYLSVYMFYHKKYEKTSNIRNILLYHFPIVLRR